MGNEFGEDEAAPLEHITEDATSVCVCAVDVDEDASANADEDADNGDDEDGDGEDMYWPKNRWMKTRE